jgi:hypothetical protein
MSKPNLTSEQRLQEAQTKIEGVLNTTNFDNSAIFNSIKHVAQAVEELSYIIAKNLKEKKILK